MSALRLGAVLDARWPNAVCDLFARDPWELLVAAILSVRATDHQVNKVMAVLAEHYVGPDGFAGLDHRDLERAIRSLPLFRQKARAIVEAARAIGLRHGGQVPRDGEALARLPGVGRKVAAVVLGNAFAIPAVAADTHIMRIIHRIGWTAQERAQDAERAMEGRFPAAEWVRRCHQIVRFGREHCRRGRPRCEQCPLAVDCPRQGVAVA